jgi:hypothetical protein
LWKQRKENKRKALADWIKFNYCLTGRVDFLSRIKRLPFYPFYPDQCRVLSLLRPLSDYDCQLKLLEI